MTFSLLYLFTLNHSQQFTRQFHIFGMSGADCHQFSGDPASSQINIADGIHYFVPDYLIVKTQFIFADDRPIMDDRRRIKTAAFAQTDRKKHA